MPTLTTPNTGIEIFYEDRGNPEAEVILLVMGLGAQMTLWPDELVAALVGDGFRVIRYDNRDIGLSQKFEGKRAPSPPVQVLRKKIGFPAKVPYTLKDMADDGIGLLDALGIARAHIVGASMGGMIAQLMAVHHGERLASLTSIMSTTGNGKLPRPKSTRLMRWWHRSRAWKKNRWSPTGSISPRISGAPAFPSIPSSSVSGCCSICGAPFTQPACRASSLRSSTMVAAARALRVSPCRHW